MRELLIITGILCLVLIGVAAEADDRVDIGVLVGINSSGMTGDMIAESDSRTSGTGSVFATFHVCNNFAIQPEVFWVRKGTRRFSTANFRIMIYRADLTFEYIEIPLLAKLCIPTERRLSYNLFAGPSVAFETKSELGGPYLTDEFGNPRGAMDIVNTRSTDISLVMGAGLEYDLRQSALVFNVRYTFSLRSITEDFSGMPGQDQFILVDGLNRGMDLKHGSLAVMVGMAF